MAKVYKVWICVEEYDTKTERGEDIDLPFASVASFPGTGEGLKRAEGFATKLNHIGEIMAGVAATPIIRCKKKGCDRVTPSSDTEYCVYHEPQS